MLTLAAILVEGRKRVPASAIAEIRDLADGLVDEHDFPPTWMAAQPHREDRNPP